MRFIYPVLAVVIVIALVLSLPVFDSSNQDFSTYNTAWNGCSELKALTANEQGVTRQTVSIGSLAQLNGTTRGVLVMLNPRDNLTNDEIAIVSSVVENGGALVLSNDFGKANALLAGMGIYQAIHFNGTLLRDDSNNWWNSDYPVVFHFANSSITNGLGTIYLNYATALDISGSGEAANTTVLAESAPSSYLGREPLQFTGEQNGSASGYEAKPVLAYFTLGKGVIVLFSDPSVFINYMLNKGDNERLYTNLLTNLTGGDAGIPVYFDESHSTIDPFWVALYDRINADDLARYAFIVSLTGVLAIGLGLSRLANKRRCSIEASADVSLNERLVVDDMMRRNPRWKRSRVERLIRNVRTRSRNGRNSDHRRPR